MTVADAHSGPSARVLVHTGKGGVGKTTVAAATAVHLAAAGHRTLVVSTDAAHSLGDVLGHPVGDRPGRVAPRLDAEQVDAQRRLEGGWREIGDYLRALLAWGGAGELEAAELALLPGLDELFALVDLIGWRDRQRRALAEVDTTFGTLPRMCVPLAADEPVGVPALGALAAALYGPTDPAAVLADAPRLEVVDDADGSALRLPLPAGRAGEVDLFQRADELYVRVGGHARNLVLPAGLRDREVCGATVADGWLTVRFAPGVARTPAAAIATG